MAHIKETSNFKYASFHGDAENAVENRFGANFAVVLQYLQFLGFVGFVGFTLPYLNPFGSNRIQEEAFESMTKSLIRFQNMDEGCVKH